MKNSIAAPLFVALAAFSAFQPSPAENERTFLSVVPRPSVSSQRTSTSKPISPAASAAKAAEKPNLAQSNKEETIASPQPEAAGNEGAPDQTGAVAPVKTLYSAQLEQACRSYKSNPGSSTYFQLLGALKSCLAGIHGRVSAAMLVKDNPYLNDLKPRVQECNGIRIWSFPKAPEKSHILLQWTETQQQVVGVGRRKHVVTSSSMHLQELALSSPVLIKDAGIITVKDLGKFLLVAGDAEDGSLKIKSYKLAEGLWQESPEFLTQIPEFLYSNVCGRLGFRGAELVFNIGKMIETTDSAGNKRLLPEAESQTYKFWLKPGESGWFVSQSLPNEEAFSVVYQFMQAVSQAKTDLEKSLLSDPRLASLPKYLGLQGKTIDPSVKVVEMTVPPGKGSRFRLINLAKDDLIFDVGKVKNQWQVKAIFVAAPDPFLAQTAKYFPHFSKFEPKVEATAEAAAPAAGAGGTGAGIRKK